MPAYNIDTCMKRTFYPALRRAGWEVWGRSGVPDEWTKRATRVHLLHVGGQTEIRWWAEYPSAGTRITERRAGPQTKVFFAHKAESADVFEQWLEDQFEQIDAFEEQAATDAVILKP